MKIFKYILLAVLFLFFQSGEIRGEHSKGPSQMASHFKKQYTDDLGGLLDRRYIRVLTTFNKTNFYVSGNKLYGFEYSLLRDYEKFLNKGLSRKELKTVMEFIPVSRDRLVPMLVDGFGDIAAAGLTITPERLDEVNFTNPYLRGVDEAIVVNKDVRGIRSPEGLSGRSVFVRRSSSYYESLVSLNKELMKKRLPPVRIMKAEENLETEDILEMVNAGAIDITVADSHLAEIWSRVFEDLRVLESVRVRVGGDIAWMVRKNNPRLKESLDRFIKTHRKGTLLGNIYFNRYYRKTKWIKNPFSEKERKTLRRYEDLFKKYSRKYNFDWMLIMALAFQESGLNNNKKSSAGAVGIMQIKPSTASGNNVGIKNVRLLENNIHAGVKYLAFVRDRYFGDEDIREQDRVRFTLAAYNAGPARVQRIRKAAERMGFDSDRWFRNTEFAALKYIGQETVRYVSNINKYYLIFIHAFEKEKLLTSKE